MDGESVEAMMTNCEQVIRNYCDEVVKEIDQLESKLEQELEESKGEEEDEDD